MIVNSKREISECGKRVYYNMEVRADNSSIPSPVVCNFTDPNPNPIVDVPEDYILSVVRASFPGTYIPIFIYPNTGNEGSRVVDNTSYSVTLTYGGNDYMQNIIYVPQDNTSPLFERYYYVFSYTYFINLINTALESAFNALKTANPSALVTQPPYLLFEPTTNIISLITQTQYTGLVDIFFNTHLYQKFESFDVIFGSFNAPNGKNVKINLSSYGNNCYHDCPKNKAITTTVGSPTITGVGFTADYDGNTISATGVPVNTIVTYVNATTLTLSQNATAAGTTNAIFVNNNLIKTSQEYPTLYLWNDIKTLILSSTKIPALPEFTPTYAGSGSGFNSNFEKILTDFEPAISSGPEIRSYYLYLPTSEYRRIYLNSKTPLSQIDLRLYWKDVRGVQHEVYIGPYGSSFSVKLLFEKKSF